MTVPVLMIPGLWNSGPLHWQTNWERDDPSWLRVQQRSWDRPDRAEWVRTLDEAIRNCLSPPVLAAHSLGCALVAQWVADFGGLGVAGAFLVAPSDVEAPGYPIEGRSFATMPLARLPFRSLVVSSTNDEYITIERARQFSEAWGSELIFIGPAGHINGASGYGPWPEGKKMFEELIRSVRAL